MIRRIEELSMNAFPSEKLIQYDGWILRSSPGNLTKRINSVNPLYPSTYPLNEKIQVSEAFFAAYDAPVVFKMTNAVLPENLDTVLEQKGYEEKSRTLILTRTLSLNSTSSDPLGFKSTPEFSDIHVEYSLTDEMLNRFCKISGKTDSAKKITCKCAH